jgi:hypothetical protein
VIAKRKYTVTEFGKLEHATESVLKSNKPLVTNFGEAKWYVVYDTPDGKYITANVWDTCGIQNTICIPLKFVDHVFRLAPNPWIGWSGEPDGGFNR